MGSPSDSDIHTFHTIWSTVLTIGGAVLAWLAKDKVKRMDKDIEGKVERDVFEIHAKSVEDKLESIDKNVTQIVGTLLHKHQGD